MKVTTQTRLLVAVLVSLAFVVSEAFVVPYLEGTGDANDKHVPLVQKRKGGGGFGGGGFSSGGSSSGGFGGGRGFSGGSFGGSFGGRGSSSSGGKGGSGSSRGSHGGSSGGSGGGKTSKTSPSYLSSQNMHNGISPVLLLGGAALAGAGAGALGGAGLAAYGAPWADTPAAHAYQNPDTCALHNSTSGQDVRLAVTCLCVQDSLCGCDKACPPATAWEDKGKVVDVKGVRTLVVNGTLDNAAVARVKASEGHRLGAVFGGGILALILIWGVFYGL